MNPCNQADDNLYLTTLKESGICNMADGPRWLRAAFDLSKAEAHAAFLAWGEQCKQQEEQ